MSGLVAMKSKRNLACLAAAILIAVAGTGPAVARDASCEAFMDGMKKNLGDLAPQFVRPVVVTRGAGRGSSVYDMITKERIDGQLSCDGDRFVRFEARINQPSTPALRDGFYRVQESSLRLKMGMSASRASRLILSMTAEAADYLRGSAERGDHFVAGKVERHEGEAGDIGLVWTSADRTFILVAYVP